ncbi:MAG: hypothetical protein ACYC8T_00680 [Myxococcaceae bacterium]
MPTLQFLKDPAIAGLTAVAEAMFPPNAYGAPDWREAEVVPRTLAYLEELPAMPRRLILALFTAVELSAPVLVGCRSRFSRLPVNRRTEAIRALRESGFSPKRLIGDALKATMTMMYVSHPKVMAHIGERAGGVHVAGVAE